MITKLKDKLECSCIFMENCKPSSLESVMNKNMIYSGPKKSNFFFIIVNSSFKRTILEWINKFNAVHMHKHLALNADFLSYWVLMKSRKIKIKS